MKEKTSFALSIMAAGIVVVILVLAAAIYKIEVPESMERNTVTVSGSSTMTVNPDQAELYVAVNNQATTADAASSANSQKVNAVMDALMRAGVDKSDMETSSYALYPVQKWDPKTEEYIQSGYEARHTLKITTKKIEDVGDLIDTAVKAGANNVNSVSFSLSDDAKEEYNILVLESAVGNAEDKANALAKSLGKNLGTVVSVSESSVYSVPYSRADFAMEEAKAGGTQIAPQDIDYSASVTVVFEIK